MFNSWYKHGVGKNCFKNLEYSLWITLTAPTHYLIQSWLIIDMLCYSSPRDDFYHSSVNKISVDKKISKCPQASMS